MYNSTVLDDRYQDDQIQEIKLIIMWSTYLFLDTSMEHLNVFLNYFLNAYNLILKALILLLLHVLMLVYVLWLNSFTHGSPKNRTWIKYIFIWWIFNIFVSTTPSTTTVVHIPKQRGFAYIVDGQLKRCMGLQCDNHIQTQLIVIKKHLH